jgi:hypothetical protein
LDQLENLRTIAEVATTFAGFTGIVVVLGHRSSGAWSASERSTIRILLETSIGTVLFALLPPIILESFSSPFTGWRVSAGLFTAYHLAIVVRADFFASGEAGQILGRAIDWGGSAVSVVSMGCTGAVTLGYAENIAPLVYTLSLLHLLLIGALSFGALLLSTDRPVAP